MAFPVLTQTVRRNLSRNDIGSSSFRNRSDTSVGSLSNGRWSESLCYPGIGDLVHRHARRFPRECQMLSGVAPHPAIDAAAQPMKLKTWRCTTNTVTPKLYDGNCRFCYFLSVQYTSLYGNAFHITGHLWGQWILVFSHKGSGMRSFGIVFVVDLHKLLKTVEWPVIGDV